MLFSQNNPSAVRNESRPSFPNTSPVGPQKTAPQPNQPLVLLLCLLLQLLLALIDEAVDVVDVLLQLRHVLLVLEHL